MENPTAWIRSRLPDGELRESCHDLFHLYEVDEDECDSFEFSYEKVCTANFRKFEQHIRMNAKRKENAVPRQTAESKKRESRGGKVEEPSPKKLMRPELSKPSPGYVVPTATGSSSSERSIKLQFHKDVPNKPYGPNTDMHIVAFKSRTQMDMGSQRRAEAIDARLTAMHDRMKLPCKEGEVGMATLEDVSLVGRLLCEADGQLNDQSMILEGSRANSNGHRVKLFVDTRVPRLTCFPGQIVAVVGKDPLGEQFNATQLIPGIELPSIPAVNMKAEASRVVVSCGPYTTRADLDFKALHSVLDHARSSGVDILVLMGPFLDATHPIIQSGAIVSEQGNPIALTDLYASHVIPALDQFSTAFSGKLLLIPSPDEVGLFNTSIPQPPLNVTPNIWNIGGAYFGPNPCFVDINGVRCCFTSQDIVAPLMKDMLVREPENTSEKVKKNEAAMRLMLWQRSLFPSHRGGVVDCTKREHYEFFEKVPSAFIFPSSSGRGFLASVIENRFFVNPGIASKPSQTGTFADVMISAEHAQCRCDIWKI